MALPIFKACCCGCTLKQGCLIIAWLGVVAGGFMFFQNVVSLCYHRYYEPEALEKAGNVIGIIVSLISIFASIVLMIGVNKKISKYIHAYVVVMIIQIIVVSITYSIEGIVFLNEGPISMGVSFLMMVFGLVPLCIYFILVVNSYDKGLQPGNLLP